MYCNLCGIYTNKLFKSHSLNKLRVRTGREYFTCFKCHMDYHKRRKDFQYWGKKGGTKTKSKGKTYYSIINKLGGKNEFNKNMDGS